MSNTNRPLAALEAIVRGRVQGVYFRAFTTRHATNLGLTGYVRNTGGGDVEVHAEGERDQLLKLVEQIEKGPPSARVEEVQQQWSIATGDFPRFEILYRP